jgi:hypothetical protein
LRNQARYTGRLLPAEEEHHRGISQPKRSLKRCRTKHLQFLGLLTLMTLALSACAVAVHRVDIQTVDRRDGTVIEEPVKVHLTDGSTGIYETGVNISAGTLRGKGLYFDIALKPFPRNPVLTPVSLESIAAMETFHDRLDKGATGTLSVLGSVAALGAGGGGASVEAGTTLEKFPLARSGQGIMIRINSDSLSVTGELIEVRHDGIIVSGSVLLGTMSGRRQIVELDQKMRWFPYDRVLASDFEKIPRLRNAIKKRRTPSSEVRAQLKLLSRFPQGLSPTLLQELLRAHGQAELIVPR